MNAPKLSIIVPVYNVEDYVGECIDSILRQTFRDYELILVDDGSTDRSGEICDGYVAKDERIVLVHKENGGVSSARNVGLRMARGNFLTFVDSDDFIAQNTYKLCMDIIIDDNSIDVIQFPYVEFPEMRPLCLLNKAKIKGSEDILANWWAGDVLTFSLWNKIYRKDMFKGISFLENHLSEDTRLIVDFYKRARCVYISDVGCYYYRQNNKSLTAHYTIDKYLDLFDAHLLIYKEMMKFSSLAHSLPIAYYRLSRKLLQAHLSDTAKDLGQEYTMIRHLAPRWRDIFSVRNVSKPYLFSIKLLGPRMFSSLFSIYLKCKSI